MREKGQFECATVAASETRSCICGLDTSWNGGEIHSKMMRVEESVLVVVVDIIEA